jgi:hypothetical protein
LILKRGGTDVPNERVRRVFSGWILGLALALLPWGIYWVVEGAVPEMFKQLIMALLTTYAKTSSLPFPTLRFASTPGNKAIVLLYYLLPLVQLIAAVGLWRHKRRGVWGWNEAVASFILVWSILYYCQVLTRTDKFHLLITLVPFFILCAWGWSAVLKTVRTAALKYLLSSIAGVAVVLFLCLTGPILLATDSAAQPVPLPRAGIYSAGGTALGDFVRAIEASAPANRSILCVPYQPMYYFLSGRRNPTRWNYFWPGDQTAQDYAMFIREARLDPPALVVIFGERDITDYTGDILDYVHKDFNRFEDGGGCTVYKPK